MLWWEFTRGGGVSEYILEKWKFIADGYYSPPGSSAHGILQARILEWVAIPFSRGVCPTQGLNPCLRQVIN